MEGSGSNEDFGGARVGDGFKRWFMVRGVWVKLHTCSTPILNGQVAWSVGVGRCGSNFRNVRKNGGRDSMTRGKGNMM